MKLRLIRIIAIILLAVSGFITIALLEIFGRTTEKLTVPIPKDANWVMRVDAATFLKEEAFTVLFEEQDEQLIKTLRTLAINSVEKQTKPKLFINVFSEMVLFGTEKNNHSFIGILIQLENTKQFAKNIPAYLKDNQSFAIVGSTGLILTRTDKTVFSKAEQDKLTSSLLNNSSPVYLTERDRKTNEWITLEIKNEEGKLQKADIGVLFNKQNVILDGELSIKGKVKMPEYDVKHEHFYLNSAFVPEDLPKIIFSGIQLGKLTFPPLENISMNYNGIVIENGSSMFRLPKMNAVLTTKTPVLVEKLISQVPAEFRMGGNKLRFSNTVYHLIQLDSKTIFFGIDPSSLIRKSPESPLMVNGELKQLASVEADGMIMTGISILIPQFNAVNAFANETEKVELSVVPERDHYKLKGNLKFKENSSSLVVITKLLLSLQLIN